MLLNNIIWQVIWVCQSYKTRNLNFVIIAWSFKHMIMISLYKYEICLFYYSVSLNCMHVIIIDDTQTIRLCWWCMLTNHFICYCSSYNNDYHHRYLFKDFSTNLLCFPLASTQSLFFFIIKDRFHIMFQLSTLSIPRHRRHL